MYSVHIIAIVLLVFASFAQNDAQDISILKSIRECIRNNNSMVCLKERALKLIDETMASDKPLMVSDYLDIVKDPSYQFNKTDLEHLPRTVKERSDVLNDLIAKRVDEFFESRTVKLNLANMFNEGRAKKGGKGGKGGMMMMAGLAMAGMMAQMAMGKIAMMAGAALMISKMALLLSSIIGIKKLVGSSGGGESSHVVYTSSGGGDHGGGGGGGGGGGWHRSMSDEEAAVLAYRAYSQPDNTV